MPVTMVNVHDVLQYHAPDDVAKDGLVKIRAAAEEFVKVILENTPTCGDQQAAIRHAREAMMTANAAVVLKGEV